jgi:MFS transporter, DHA1 family, multidrug resistance protein
MSSTITMNKRHLLLLCICIGLMAFQATITVRLLPVYAVYLGAEPAMTGLLVAGGYLTVTLGNITGGWLSDRLGVYKRLLLLSCAAWIPVGLLMTQATDMPRLILTTMLFWFPGGIALAIVNTLTALSAGAGERGKVFGYMALAGGTGALLAGALGGPIAERWGWPVLFMAMVALLVLLLLIATTVHDKRIPRNTAQPQTPGTPNMPTMSKQLGLGGLLMVLLAANLLVRLSQLIGGLGTPLTMAQLGFNAADVSSSIAVSAAITLPLPLFLGWLSDRVGRKRCLIVCNGLGALGLLLLIPALWLWQFWLATSLLAIAEKSNSVAQAYAADLTPAHAMGRGMSLFHSTSLLAGVFGMGGAGYMMQTIGINPTFLVGACLSLIAIGILLFMRRPALRAGEPSVAQVKA